MLKRTLSLALTCLIVLCFVGCGNTTEPAAPTLPALKSTAQAADVSPAEGYEVLGGSWVVGGLFYKGHLIDINDDDALIDLYDSTYLMFYEGGTFHYMNAFNSRGKYIKQDDSSFILKTETVFTYDFSEEGLVEKEAKNPTLTSYLVSLLDEDTIIWDKLDPMTGKAAADSNTLVFVREDVQSAYIKEHKTALKGSSEPENSEDDTSAQAADTSTATAEEPAQTQLPDYESSGMRNALKSAKGYLDVMPFSYSGLVEQLEFEGYSHAEATYAADNCGADWYEQAVRAAQEYLDVMPFSRSELIEQLEYEGYTNEQATYGVDKVY